MRISITKGEREDIIEADRGDGTRVRTTFPHKGPIPHDAVHFYVESILAIPNAFWGMVADGKRPQDIADIAKVAGHASATRASLPDSEIIPLVQAERAVECFEADLWSGAESSPQLIRDMIEAGCAQSLVPPMELSDHAIEQVQASLADLRSRWSAAVPGTQLVLHWAATAR